MLCFTLIKCIHNYYYYSLYTTLMILVIHNIVFNYLCISVNTNVRVGKYIIIYTHIVLSVNIHII